MGNWFFNQSEQVSIKSTWWLCRLAAAGCRHQKTHFILRSYFSNWKMEPLSKVDEPFPTPPPYFLPDESKTCQDVRIYHIHSPFSPPPPPPSSSSSPASAPPQTPRVKFVSYESDLYRSPALATCPSCQAQVTTQVTYRAGKQAWLACLAFVLCGLVLGCCLIPFFARRFKDAYHTCPRCRRVLHVHRKTCCE